MRDPLIAATRAKLAAQGAEAGPRIPAVANHPNRSKLNRGEASNPTPEEVRELRERLELTQTEAARIIHGTLRAWQNWEAPKGSPEHRPMHPGLWELFRIKTEHLRRD